MSVASHALTGAVLIALVAPTLAACDPKLEQPTWERADVEQLRKDLAEPTAPLKDIASEEFRARLEALLQKLLPVLDYVEGAVETLDELSDEGPADTAAPATDEASATATGAQGFLRVACPAPGERKPDPEFGHGWLQVETAVLQRGQVRYGSGADMLLILTACRLGSIDFEVELPGWLEDTAPEDAGALQARVLLDMQPLRLRQGRLSVRTASVRTDGASVVVEGPDGTAIVDIVVRRATVSVALRAADGGITCAFHPLATLPLECDLAGQ